jgi:hypothetical protein
VKLRASAARTKALSDPRLSIHKTPFRTSVSDIFGTMARFSNPWEHPFWVQRRDRPPSGDGPADQNLVLSRR